MANSGDITFYSLVDNPDAHTMPDVVRFISSLGPALHDRRIGVASKTSDGTVIALSSFRRVRVPQLNNNLLFECQLHLNSDQNRELSWGLLSESVASLEVIGDKEQVIGIITILHNHLMLRDIRWKRATWPESGFILMGYTKGGDPIYVRYFRGARI